MFATATTLLALLAASAGSVSAVLPRMQHAAAAIAKTQTLHEGHWHPNLVVNSGFEANRTLPPYDVPTQPNQANPFGQNSVVVPGWTLQTDPFFFTGVYPQCQSKDGLYSVQFGSQQVDGLLSQWVPTEAGRKYCFSFWLFSLSCDNAVHSSDGEPWIIYVPSCPLAGTTGHTNHFTASVNGASQEMKPHQKHYELPFPVDPFDDSFVPSSEQRTVASFQSLPNSNVNSHPWVQYSKTFKATSASTQIKFAGTNWGAFFALDSVSVTLGRCHDASDEHWDDDSWGGDDWDGDDDDDKKNAVKAAGPKLTKKI